jgi:O-methyltransferase
LKTISKTILMTNFNFPKTMLSPKSTLKSALHFLGLELIKEDQEVLDFSRIYEKYGDYTMIPKTTFIKNLKLCNDFRAIKGNVVECGVWRGGMIAAIAELLGNDRTYYLLDSFEGLPEAQKNDGEAAKQWQEDKEGLMYFDNCKAEVCYAEEAMKLADIKNYQTIKGWFSETLPKFNVNQEISILRLDGDWYDSILKCLNYLYPSVVKGGLIILDDYYVWDGCSRAVHDYLSSNNIPDRICQLDHNNCYIVKS